MLSSEKSPDIRNLQSLHLSLSQADKLHVLHPWTDLSALGDGCPLIMTSASGIRVSDSQGRTYLDAIGGMWCMTLGYGRTELAIAMSAQAQRMAYYTPFGDIGNEPAARLAEVLAEITPGDLDRVHFTTGGSTAIDSAVRISHYYFASQGRYSKRWVLSRHNAYHGSTFLAASLSGKAADRTLFHYEESFVHHLSSPGYDLDVDDETSEETLERLISEMEREIARIGAENIACFVAEPILASGGVLIPPSGYHVATRELCRMHDILYISDEVVTGFGRLGHFFSSKARFSIDPDLLVIAKGLTSGYAPLGAVLISTRISQSIAADAPRGKPVFSNGFTYSGHPVSCAVALKNIELMQREHVCEHVRDVGPYFMEQLYKLSASPVVYTVRGDHLMACVECWTGAEKGPTVENIALARRVDHHCQEAGLLVRPYENLCILSPPLIIGRDDIDRIVTTLHLAIEKTEHDLKSGAIM